MITALRYALAFSLATLFVLFGFSANAQVTVLSEDFEGGSTPAGWALTQAAGSAGWLYGDATFHSSGFWTVPAPPTGTDFMASNDDACNCDMSSDFLDTPVFDLTGYTSAELRFDRFLNFALSAGNVLVSTDNGVTFLPLVTLTTDPAWQTEVVDLTPYVGNSQVIIRFHHDDGGAWAYGFAVDNVIVEAILPGLDLAITDQVSPDPATAPDCSGNPLDVIVTIENTNTVAITTATIDWTINGTPQTPFNYSGTLNTGNTADIALGAGVTINAGDVIEATIASVNGGPTSAQTSTTNDNLTLLNPVGLTGGTFVVGPTGDILTVEAAFATLETAGICGPVVLEIENGTYSTNASLVGPVAGSSATNTITLTSQSGNATDVVLQHNASSATDNYVLQLEEVSNFTVSNLTLQDADLTDQLGVLLEYVSTSDNHLVDGVIFEGDTTANVAGSTTEDLALLFLETDQPIDELTIQNCEFYGGTQGINDDGDFFDDNLNHFILNNRFENQSYRSIEFNDIENLSIIGNTFINDLYEDVEVIWGEDAINGRIEGNSIFALNSAIGMELDDIQTIAPGTATLINNSIYIGSNSGTIPSEGIYFHGGSGDTAQIQHNTVFVENSTDAASVGFWFDAAVEGNTFENNSIVLNGLGTAVIFGDDLVVLESDYNNFFVSGGGELADWNGTVANTIADLNTASTLDANSINVSPNFVSIDTLIPTNPAVQLANPIAGITTDLLGDARDAVMPSAGAFEYRFVPGLDLELTSASHPALTSPYCGAAGALTLTITNTLAMDITSATISGTLNGGPLPFPDFNYAPGSPLTSGNTDVLTIVAATPGIAPADGDSIALFITDVNGGAMQDDLTNDTLIFGVTYGLDGTYSIDPAGLGDFLVLDQAFDVAEAGGVCAPTTLNFVDGTHTTNASLDGPIGGLDATNTLTITSQSANVANVTLQFDPETLTENFTIRLDEAGHTTISNLTFEETGNDDDFSSQVVLLNAANGNIIVNNIFNGDPNTTGTTGAQALVVVAGEQDDLSVVNNTFNEASSGFFAPAAGGEKANTVLDNNTFNDQHVTGVFFDNGSNPSITNNVVTNTTTSFYPFAGFILGDFTTAGEIANNRVETDRAGLGMFFDYLASATVVSNNVSIVGDVNGGAGSPTFAIDVFYGDDAFFYHNTGVVTAATDPESAGYRDRGGSYAYELENNIFVNLSANGFAYVSDDGAVSGGLSGPGTGTGSSDYNAYFAPNTDLAEWGGTAAADLAALQTANTVDASSVEGDPLFNDLANYDVNVCEPTLAVANPLASVMDDINGDTRDAATPTAGAQEVSPVPNAAPFLAADTTICAGVNLTIGLANTAGLTYSWNNGPILSEQTITAGGTYELTISSACGSQVDEIVVSEFTPGDADFTFAPGVTKFDFDFTNASTGDGSAYSWDFGDGSPASTMTSPSHTYSSLAGSPYTVTLTYTDTCGNVTTHTETVTIDCDALVADFTSAQGMTKFDYDFTDASTGDVESWSWDYGDGSALGTTQNPSHTYSSIGSYIIELEVTDSCGNTDVFTQTVTIDCDPLAADFSSAQGATNLDYDFTDLSTGDVESWTWDYGDGSALGTTQNPSHTYATAGTYTVTLEVTDSCGNTATHTETITAGIVCDPLVASFTTTPGANKFEFDFTNTSTGSIDVSAISTAFDWDFGDGNVASDQNPTHSYAGIGTYTVTFTVTDSCGDIETATETITVDCDPLVADFTSVQGATVLDRDFTDASSGDIQDWEWDFDDGSPAATVQNPSHTYATAGTYTVTLTVTDSCGNTQTFDEDITAGIVCDPLNADFTFNQVASFSFDFTNTSTGSIDLSAGSTAFEWDFGDGSPTSTAQDPSHIYTTAGTFTVTLTVTDSCGNTDTHTEIVTPGTAPCTPIAVDFTIAQGGTPFDFILEFEGSGDIANFDWEIDGITYTGDSINVNFPDTGTYSIELVVTDDCGDQDSITKVITIQTDSRAEIVDAGLSIYPNPATDFITMRFETMITDGSIEIYSLNGQLIQRQVLTANIPEQTVSLQDISDGLYMVRILEAGESVSQRKLIIRR